MRRPAIREWAIRILLLAPALLTPAKGQALVEPAQATGGCCRGAVSQLRQALLGLPDYGVFDAVQLEASGNSITLLGEVTCRNLKEDAAAVAGTNPGVRRVVNRIAVIAPDPGDDRIRLATFDAIYGYSRLNWYAHRPIPPIRIVVNHGAVTLMGTVGSESDKNLAGTLARHVADVSSVVNQLRVEP
ncbi:MAG TPA: BON domain-containing protein [Bryobacteraceae bacterium]|nr:BON domain-containing protein [Bryobacteraceae bacterium]